MTGTARDKMRKLLFVGAFPPPISEVVGGNVSDCRALLASSFPERVALTLIDSTQASLPAPPLSTRARIAARRIRAFVTALHREHPDAVLIFASAGLGFLEKSAFALYARIRGIPTLMSIRSGHFIDACRRSAIFRAVARRLVRVPARLLCQGEQWKRFFVDDLGVTPDRCIILENWVASAELLAITRRPPRTSLSVLFLGWLEPFKGIFDLLDAVRIVAKTPGIPRFALSIAGGGGSKPAIMEYVEKHGLQELVQLSGVVLGRRKHELLEAADIFVLPSHTEGLPNAMIEAMAASLPVVVTPVGSIPDVIQDGMNGLLVPARDPGQLAKALTRLLTDSELRERLASAGRATASQRFDVEHAVDVLLATVDEVASGAHLTQKQPVRENRRGGNS